MEETRLLFSANFSPHFFISEFHRTNFFKKIRKLLAIVFANNLRILKLHVNSLPDSRHQTKLTTPQLPEVAATFSATA